LIYRRSRRGHRWRPQSYCDFGKGSCHSAGLNFGDCFGYALAKEASEAILFKGDDFSRTDLIPALK
jgi:ribonuclease VapC